MISETRHADKKMKLGEVCNLILGQSPSSDSYNTDGVGLPFYQGNADFGEDHPTPRVWCNEPKKVALPGDILISVRAPIGAINVADEKCCIGRGVAAIEPYCKIVSRDFLKQQLLAKRAMLESRGTGSTFKAVGKRALLDFPIRVYPLPEQAHIEQQFKQALSSISAYRHYLTLLDALVKSRFIELFGDPDNTIYRVGTVEDIADVTVGVVIKPKRYYTEDSLNGVKAFRSLNVGEMHVKDSDWVYFTREGNQECSKSMLKEGDVLIVRSGYPGTSCVVPIEFEGCNAVDLIIARPDKSQITPGYLAAFNNGNYVKSLVARQSVGSAQKHFNVGFYKKMKLPIPPIEVQMEFIDFMRQVDKSKSIARKQIEKLQLLYDSLAQEYFGD